MKTMKKITAFALILALALSLCACGSAQKPAGADEADTNAQSADAAATELQKAWNGWYYGCIDLYDCTGAWEVHNDETYDAVMFVELDGEGVGHFEIYDPFGSILENDENNLYAEADCHADEQFLSVDGGTIFDCDMNASEWRFVHNLDVPEKLNVGSSATNDDGETICFDFQFKPWGDRWEDDSYTKFIPNFDAYLSAVDAGLALPFEDGFGAPAETTDEADAADAADADEKPTKSTDASAALLGSSPAKLDVNDKGAVYVYYPADQFHYDDDYGKLKNDDSGVGILIDPMLGAKNFDELKQSYAENNSDEDDYSLEETTVNGCKALILKYSDWLGATMRVDIDFGGEHDGFYGMSFAVSGDALEDCDTDLVWAIINSMELAK